MHSGPGPEQELQLSAAGCHAAVAVYVVCCKPRLLFSSSSSHIRMVPVKKREWGWDCASPAHSKCKLWRLACRRSGLCPVRMAQPPL